MKVTIIIPVYNQEKLVIKALESIPKRKDIEVIVIDDGSTDNTWEKVIKYKLENEDSMNLRALQNKENKGVGYTVNRGYDNAKGEYIVLLGSDDYFYTDEFEKCIEELDGTDLIYFNLKLNDGYVWQLNEQTKRDYCGSTKFIKRDFLGKTRNPELRAREDWYFYLDLLAKNPTEKFTNLIVKHYNFPREGSLTWIACNGFKKEDR